MFLTPTGVLKRRLAREFCKIQNVRSMYTKLEYRVAERGVINNKPHITLNTVEKQESANPYGLPYLGTLMGLPLPQDVEEYEGDEDEMESVNKS